MNISPETIHELSGLAARISSIISLVRSPEEIEKFGLQEMSTELKTALKNLETRWDEVMKDFISGA